MQAGAWPARWIRVPAAKQRGPCDTTSLMAAYRLELLAESDCRVRVLVSADERYELYLDGRRLRRGPERGDADNWYYDAVELDLGVGSHVLVARVWSAGLFTAPWSHVSVQHGFLLAPADPAWTDRLATGVVVVVGVVGVVGVGVATACGAPGHRGCALGRLRGRWIYPRQRPAWPTRRLAPR